jgi:hypothetical protein
MARNPVVLNPDDEFEAQLIAIARMHRKKSETYGTGEDDLQNFTDGAYITGETPLNYGFTLMVKHISAIMNARRNGTPAGKVTEEMFIDLAVYGVILKVLHDREKNGN